MQTLRNTFTVVAVLHLFGCSSNKPYEKPITKYFEDKMKVVPILREITVDTSATMISFESYWSNRVTELKADLTRDYEKQYVDTKETCEKRAKQDKERAR